MQAMKTYRDDRVYLHLFLMPTLDGGEWSAHSSCITPGEGTSSLPIEYEADWGHRASVDILEKRKISCFCQDMNPEHSLVTVLTS